MQEDSAHAISQMVYWQNIRLPREFFHENTIPHIFAKEFQDVMKEVGSRPVSKKYFPKIIVPKDLKRKLHMFIRLDRIEKQLKSPYEGSFEGVDRKVKYFTFRIKLKTVTVSIDSLKLAYFLKPRNFLQINQHRQNNQRKHHRIYILKSKTSWKTVMYGTRD